MKTKFTPLFRLLLTITLGFGASLLSAQQATSRIAGDWRSSAPRTISGSQTPTTSIVASSAPASARLERMILLLNPSATQKTALTNLLSQQLNSASSSYHRWLTPAEFAARFSPSADDVEQVVEWLRTSGFTVDEIPASRGWIVFSGSVSQVESSFGTRIAVADSTTGTRPVLASTISIPSVLAPLVAGIASLDGSVVSASITTTRPLSNSLAEMATATSISATQAITPSSAATLLKWSTLHSNGVTGRGIKIALPSRSNLRQADLDSFRAGFSLGSGKLTTSLISSDPGYTADRAATTLAASWIAATAPAAEIVLVPAANTEATDGVDLALAAIVDKKLGAILPVGYSACEASLSSTHQQFYAALYRQAAAEGISVIAATGNSGAAACHLAGSSEVVSTGYAVNALASTPWNLAVGAAAFSGNATSGRFAAWAQSSTGSATYAGGGGRSALYGAPVWQSASISNAITSATAAVATTENSFASATSKSHRLLPDLALPTAFDEATSGLTFCMGETDNCTAQRAGGSGASAALMAGIVAMAEQSSGALGNIAPAIHHLGSASDAFTDIASGSNQLACAAESTNCNSSEKIGYTAATGYDLASGLGSVNASQLVTALGSGSSLIIPTVTLSLSPTATNNIYNPTAAITFTASVKDATAAGTPLGKVTFYAVINGVQMSAGSVSLSASSSAANTSTATYTVSSLANLGISTTNFQVGAEYAGDSTTYASADASLATVTTQKSTTTIALTSSATSAAVGSTVKIIATIGVSTSGPAAGSSAPTGTVTLTVGSSSTTYTGTLSTLSGVTTATFDAVTLPAIGTNAITATYAGDSYYTSATSSALSVTATKGTTTTTIAAAGTPSLGTASTTWTLVATVTATASTPTLTGSVAFYDNGALLGSTTTLTCSSNVCTATLSSALVNNLAHKITATYSGDTNWATSTTATAYVIPIETIATTTTLTANYSSSNPAPPGTLITFTATVTPSQVASGEANPTGYVVFYNGTTQIAKVALVASATGDTSTATYATSTLAAGTDSIKAVYLGDDYYTNSSSSTFTIKIENFTITPAASNPAEWVTITKGSSGSASYVIAGVGGFTDQVQVICTVPSDVYLTCTPSPIVVTPDKTITFAINTFTTGGVTISKNQHKSIWPNVLGGGALTSLCLLLLPPMRRRIKPVAHHFLVLVLLLTGLGCAGLGCSSSGSSSSSSGGTALGTYSLTITATPITDNTVVSKSLNLYVKVVSSATN